MNSLGISWREKWAEHPVRVRHVHNFDIILNEHDVYGPSPAIGITGTYEPHVTELFRRLLRRDSTVVDVGANIGWYTLNAATAVSVKGRIIAFEPEPNNFSLLSRSIALNSMNNVELIRESVSDRQGHQTLFLADGNIGGHSTTRAVGLNRIEVPSTTLDLSLAEFGVDGVHVLKVDVEGAEPQVVLGAAEQLKRVDNMIMEWNPEAWTNHLRTLDILFESFKVYEIFRSPFLIRRITRESVLGLPQTNLYFHKES